MSAPGAAPSLAVRQAAIRDVVLGSDDPAVAAAAGIAGHGLTPAQRLAIHRNTTHITLIEALGENLPVVKTLVGEAFFAQAARAFLRGHPPTSPILAYWGEGFADFLATYAPAASLPYLPDVARLEQARLSALDAADATPLPPDALARVPAPLLPLCRCAVHPAFRFVVSAWPVDRIWAMHQPDWPADDTVSLDDGGATVLIGRPHETLLMVRADHGTLSLLLALGMGQTLETAIQAATRTDVAFDLTRALTRVLSLGLLTEVLPPGDHDGEAPRPPASRSEDRP
ncbi:DNA-binding domain-containing protein [Roseospira visakhapatnamensis]|uniref:Putative DNA-binding domain-containing protein n=1 Tax=Roseospira visakhapatnamensis TaxID=390880 RepID=A0A7W6RDJ0_9PROT|nr:DNA-binding domain-containing protein [Roseospira visakhapatnamensis]MBB4266467.1 hypothetical protein [Roseospira visakhapatnamensis]